MIPDQSAREVSVNSTPQVRKRPKPYFFPIVAFLMGAMVFMNVAGRAAFQAYRAVDVVSLIAVGMLFGVGATRTAFLFRRARVP
jgi:uncharacterized membrane protein